MTRKKVCKGSRVTTGSRCMRVNTWVIVFMCQNQLNQLRKGELRPAQVIPVLRPVPGFNTSSTGMFAWLLSLLNS